MERGGAKKLCIWLTGGVRVGDLMFGENCLAVVPYFVFLPSGSSC